MTDVLAKLPPNAFRGIQFPITGREFGFAQELEKERYVFRDRQLIESLGKENPTYRYTIPFDEGIARGPYSHLFTVTYSQFKTACEDRSAGFLNDCLHGPVRVKCASWSETLAPDNKSGISVNVSFIVDPDEDAAQRTAPTQPIETIESGRDYAGFLDQEIAKTDWPEQEQPESRKDLFDSINSIGDQASVAQGRAEAVMHKVAYDCERTTKTIDKIKDPELGTTRRANRRMQLGAVDLGRSIRKPARPMKVVRTATEMGKLSCAALYGIAVEEFDSLNQSQRRNTRIPAGAVLVVPRG